MPFLMHPRIPRFGKPCLLLLFFLCLAPFAPLFAQTPDEWPPSTPEDQGVDSAQLVRLLMRLQSDHLRIDDILVLRHGQLVTELYTYPNNAADRHVLFSATKSFASSLIGIAIDRGFIKNVDEKVLDLLKTNNKVNADPRASQMTLRHLLTMSTGHAVDTTNTVSYSTDWVKAFLEFPIPNTPGSPFVYNSAASCMLMYALESRVGVGAARFAEEQLLTPLGITGYTWDKSPAGVPIGGWGLYLRARDFARFGQLYLNRGRWNGRQLVPEAWVDACSRPQVSTGNGGHWGSGYSYQFWINHFGGYRADGAFGQFAYILPERDTVVVFNSPLNADNSVPPGLMETYVLPALGDGSPLPGNPVARTLLQQHLKRLSQAYAPANALPLFLSSPIDQTVPYEGSLHLTVALENPVGASFQWYHEGRPLAEATGPSLDLPQLHAGDSGIYWVLASNANGSTRSLPFRVNVQAPPVVDAGPTSQYCSQGASVLLAVKAHGTGLSYSWSHDGTPVAGANSASLMLPACTADDAGSYAVTVSNDFGSVTTGSVRLGIAPADTAARLANLSARGYAGTGDDTFTIGVNIRPGTRCDSLPVLLRGVGPALSAFNVSPVLQAPTLSVLRDQTQTSYNETSVVEPGVAALCTVAGAFNLGAPQGDQACLQQFKPGSNTLQISSALPGLGGITLGECYEAPGAAIQGGARLSNLSARATITPGEGTLEAGFIIAGSGSVKILIRGIGPTLGAFGIRNPLQSPTLELFKSGTLLAKNQNWSADQALKTAFAQTGAFALPDDSNDCALLLSLGPGSYTAHLSAPNQSSGTGLLEIYEVP